MTLIRIVFVLLATLCVQSLSAQTLSFKSLEEVESGGYLGLDPLNVFLLYEHHSQRQFEPGKVLQTMGPEPFGPLSDALQRWSTAADPATQTEVQTQLNAQFDSRRQSIKSAAHYWIPLLTEQESINAANAVTFQISIDVHGNSGSRSMQCTSAVPEGTSRVHSCLTIDPSLLNADIFRSIPAASQEAAKSLRDLLAQGQWRLIALVRPVGPYVFKEGSGGSHASMGLQAVDIVGLALVNAQNGQVVNSTAVNPNTLRPQHPSVAGNAPSVNKDPGQTQNPSDLSFNRPQTDQGTQPPMDADRAQGGTDPVFPEGPPLSMADRQLDELLALLSLTVYTSADQFHAVDREHQSLLKKHARITRDNERLGLPQSMEMIKVFDKIQKLDRKRQSLATQLKLKETAPPQSGAMRVNAKAVPGLVYERYRLNDGREVFVFKGTSTWQDVLTDVELITSPETIAEIRSLASQSGGITAGASNWVLNRVTAAEDTPRLFNDAYMVVRQAIRSGLKPEKIIVTGHSLGGGLAQYVGMKNRVGLIVTFNTAPLNERMLAEMDQQELQNHSNKRHYISVINGGTKFSKDIHDPVSQKLWLSQINTLQVVGYPVKKQVCSDIQSESYVEFFDAVQGRITRGTVSAMAMGSKLKPLGTIGTVGGAGVGVVNANTDVLSSAKTNAKIGKRTGTAIAAGHNCIKHPFLCAGVFAAGGIVSSLATGSIPLMWNVLSAHSMQNLYDAIAQKIPDSCQSYP